MTYMPLLGKHILGEMDVEALTAELQSISRTAEVRRSTLAAAGQEPTVLPPQQSPRPDSLESSVELVRSSDARSEASSASFLSMSPRPEVSQLAESMAGLSSPQPLPPPAHSHAPQSLEASSSSLELQGSSSGPSAQPVETKAVSESVVSGSAFSSNSDSVVVSA
jgi:peroxin-3